MSHRALHPAQFGPVGGLGRTRSGADLADYRKNGKQRELDRWVPMEKGKK